MAGEDQLVWDNGQVDAHSSGSDPRRWWTLVLLCCAFLVVVSDSTIVYTALPTLEEDLSFAGGSVRWVIIAYTLVSGGFLLLGGRLADLLGRRRVFLAGTALFTGASLLCGFAWSSGVLIAARVVEGFGGAIMVPAALAMLMTTFAEGPERNRALGVWGSLGGIAATLGLLLGGPLTDGPGWRWVFFVNVPIGAGVLVMGPRLLAESRDRGRLGRCFDLTGAVTVTVALLAFVYAVVEAPDVGWTALRTIGLLVVAVALVGVFVVVEARTSVPLVPLRIFRSRTLVGGNLVILAAGLAVDGLLFTFTLYAQQVLGYTAVQFGLAMAVMTVTSFVGVFVGQHLVTRIGFRPVAAAGLTLVGAGSLLLTQVSAQSSFWGEIFPGLAIFGPGMGAAFVAGQIAALAGVPEGDSGVASGVEETSFTIGITLGVAVLSSIAASQSDLVAGTQAAFAGAAIFAVLGLTAALVLLRRQEHTGSPDPQPQAVPAAGPPLVSRRGC